MFMGYEKLRHRLKSGRPLVVDADIGASLRERGVDLDCPGALGAVLRTHPAVVTEHHTAEASCRVDVLSALTADTTPRALAEVGMEHRSAMLTGRAVELALDVAKALPKPVAVAGVLGSDQVTALDRIRSEEELREHALRIAVAGAELMIVRGMGSRIELAFAVGVASEAGLPTWAVIDRELSSDAALGDLVESLCDAGAEAVVFEVASVDEGLACLERVVGASGDVVPGVFLAASADALRGFPSPHGATWVDRSVELTNAGARIVGGGAGTVESHTQALAAALGALHPSIAPSTGTGGA